MSNGPTDDIESSNKAISKKPSQREQPVCATILLIEDDTALRECTVEILGHCGFAAIPARDGSEALQLAQNGVAFDLLFTDLDLPGSLSGCEVAEEMRRLRPNLPVVFTSGYPDCDRSNIGGAAFLMKPYKVTDLAATLLGAIKQQRIYAKFE